MSEKRFILAEDSNGLFSIFDNEDLEDEPLIYGARFGTEKIVDLLNEQDKKIKELSIKYANRETKIIKEVGDILQNNFEIMDQRLSDENKHLKKRIKAISDELYCKDRKLEELGIPIECCDRDE